MNDKIIGCKGAFMLVVWFIWCAPKGEMTNICILVLARLTAHTGSLRMTQEALT